MELRLKSLVAILVSCLALNAAAESTVLKFKSKVAQLGKKTITVEIAESEKQLEQGLMFRKKLAANAGMLFIFPDEQPRSFWMKNTLIDLSIGYFDKQKKLIDFQEMTATSTVMQQNLPFYPSKGPAMYALEMNKGWFKKNKIEIGTILKF